MRKIALLALVALCPLFAQDDSGKNIISLLSSGSNNRATNGNRLKLFKSSAGRSLEQKAQDIARQLNIGDGTASYKYLANSRENEKYVRFNPDSDTIHYHAIVSPIRDKKRICSPLTNQGIAVRFMKSLGIKDDEYFLENISEHKVFCIDETNVSVEDVTYIFRRKVDGISAYGPGTSILVCVGKEGIVRNAVIDWSDFEYQKDLEIEDPIARKDELQHKVSESGRRIKEKGGHFDSPEKMWLVYRSTKDMDGTTTLAPVYMTVMVAKNDDHEGQIHQPIFHTACSDYPVK